MYYNTPDTWGITLAYFDGPNAKWGRTIVNKPEVNKSINTTSSIYFDNLPIVYQKGLLKADGTVDTNKLENHFYNKAKQVIDGIVKARSILNKGDVFSLTPDFMQTALRDAVVQVIQNALENSFSERTTANNISTSGLTISDNLTNWITSGSMMGTFAWNTLMNSKVHLIEYDPAAKKLTYNDDAITTHFKSKELVKDVEINSKDPNSLQTLEAIVELIGQAVSGSKVEILSSSNIDDLKTDYDAFIKANSTQTHVLGDVIDIQYTGTEALYLSPDIVEQYVFDGTDYIIISAAYQAREERAFIAANLNIQLEAKADKDEVIKKDNSVDLSGKGNIDLSSTEANPNKVPTRQETKSALITLNQAIGGNNRTKTITELEAKDNNLEARVAAMENVPAGNVLSGSNFWTGDVAVPSTGIVDLSTLQDQAGNVFNFGDKAKIKLIIKDTSVNPNEERTEEVFINGAVDNGIDNYKYIIPNDGSGVLTITGANLASLKIVRIEQSVFQASTNLASQQDLADEAAERQTEDAKKVDKIDLSLNTTTKEVVKAINEIHNKLGKLKPTTTHFESIERDTDIAINDEIVIPFDIDMNNLDTFKVYIDGALIQRKGSQIVLDTDADYEVIAPTAPATDYKIKMLKSLTLDKDAQGNIEQKVYFTFEYLEIHASINPADTPHFGDTQPTSSQPRAATQLEFDLLTKLLEYVITTTPNLGKDFMITENADDTKGIKFGTRDNGDNFIKIIDHLQTSGADITMDKDGITIDTHGAGGSISTKTIEWLKIPSLLQSFTDGQDNDGTNNNPTERELQSYDQLAKAILMATENIVGAFAGLGATTTSGTHSLFGNKREDKTIISETDTSTGATKTFNVFDKEWTVAEFTGRTWTDADEGKKFDIQLTHTDGTVYELYDVIVHHHTGWTGDHVEFFEALPQKTHQTNILFIYDSSSSTTTATRRVFNTGSAVDGTVSITKVVYKGGQ